MKTVFDLIIVNDSLDKAYWALKEALSEAQVQSLGWEDPLEEGMATHSGILA